MSSPGRSYWLVELVSVELEVVLLDFDVDVDDVIGLGELSCALPVEGYSDLGEATLGTLGLNWGVVDD